MSVSSDARQAIKIVDVMISGKNNNTHTHTKPTNINVTPVVHVIITCNKEHNKVRNPSYYLIVKIT